MVFFSQAYNLSRDHKPDLEVERERIMKAGGFIHAGRVNGSLNLARAIGMHVIIFLKSIRGFFCAVRKNNCCFVVGAVAYKINIDVKV